MRMKELFQSIAEQDNGDDLSDCAYFQYVTDLMEANKQRCGVSENSNDLAVKYMTTNWEAS